MENMPGAKLPRTWESLFGAQAFLPVIVKTIEKIHDTSWSMDVNYHDHFEMVYFKRGEAVFQVAGTDVPMSVNDIIIIKPHQAHKFIVRSKGGCEFFVLSFKFTSTTDGHASDLSLTDFIEFVNDESTAFINLKLNRKNEIVGVLNRILREHDRQQIWSDYLCYLMIMELFILISRNLKQEWEQSIRSRSVKLKELLNISKEYINANYSRELSLSDVAGYIFLSESYFAHTFKDEFGISPKKYLLNVRIDAAKDLLANTDQKINDIAKEIGFSSQQRFNDIFKKYEKMTPLHYRKQEKTKRINFAG
ncbi:MAG: AraC family transcriptional regulator [Ruminococcaceae bacterium]|nr:AraC family transcriptional regulator [Oscillospiraceae bacterium]